MTSTAVTVDDLAERVLATSRKGARRLVAIAGAPASGKSTLAAALAARLTQAGCPAQVVPMDGFHLHNDILTERGLIHKKGAPQTFDAGGFLHLVSRLSGETEVFFPQFDRARDIAIAGAGEIGASCDTVIIEGNYLLHDAPIWRELTAHWDLAIRLDVATRVLRERLVDRWLAHGLTPAQATKRAEENDLKNVETITQHQLPADITI